MLQIYLKKIKFALNKKSKMETTEETKNLELKIIDVLKTVYDPEIPANIYDMGLIYKIKIDENKTVKISMTLTSPNCPVAESLPLEVQEKVSAMTEVNNCYVDLVFEPEWTTDMMSEEAQLDLGLL